MSLTDYVRELRGVLHDNGESCDYGCSKEEYLAVYGSWRETAKSKGKYISAVERAGPIPLNS